MPAQIRPSFRGRLPVCCSDECRKLKRTPRPPIWSDNFKDYERLAKAKERREHDAEQNRINQDLTTKSLKTPTPEVKDAMDAVIADLERGLSIERAMARQGRTKSTFYQWYKRWTHVFAARADLAIAKAQGNFTPEDKPFDVDFRKRYFGFETPRHLALMMDLINSLTDEARRDGEPKIGLILVPPDFAKSTLTEDWLSQQLAVDPNLRCFFLSKTESTAKKRVGRIMRRMTDTALCPEFIEDYGPFKADKRLDGKPFTARLFTVFHQSSGERDASMEALGIGGHIYNVRADRIVGDDIADLDNQTPTEVAKQAEYLQLEVRSRLTETGVMVMIGTYIREAGIYQKLEELGFFDKVLKMPAIFEADCDFELSTGEIISFRQGESLWPERHPIAKLEKLRDRTDPRIWALSFQQNPLPSIGAIFTQESIEACYDDDRYIGHIPDNSICVAGIDPSVTNYTAGVVFALRRTESGEWMRYLVDVWNETGLTGEGGDTQAGVVEFIVELCREYRVRYLCVEDGAWMGLINNSFTLRSKLNALGVNHHGIKVSDVTTGEQAFRQLSGIFNHRLISIPASPSSLQRLQPMVHQFLTYTGEKQHWRKQFDIIKAFRMAEWAVKDFESLHLSADAKVSDNKPAYMQGRRLQAVS